MRRSDRARAIGLLQRFRVWKLALLRRRSCRTTLWIIREYRGADAPEHEQPLNCSNPSDAKARAIGTAPTSSGSFRGAVGLPMARHAARPRWHPSFTGQSLTRASSQLLGAARRDPLTGDSTSEGMVEQFPMRFRPACAVPKFPDEPDSYRSARSSTGRAKAYDSRGAGCGTRVDASASRQRATSEVHPV
jgi:hypothetical protein